MQVDCLKCRVERVIENSTSLLLRTGSQQFTEPVLYMRPRHL